MLLLLCAVVLSCASGCTRTIGAGTVRCHYMSCACGNCTPQFKVDSVLAGPLDGLLQQDIHIELDGSTAFADSLECLICWTFIAEGNARMNGSTFTLHAVRIERHPRPGCCDHP